MTSLEFRSRQSRLNERRRLLTKMYDEPEMQEHRSAIQIALNAINREIRHLYAEADVCGIANTT